MSELAILGGQPAVNELPRYNSIGQSEIDAVSEVMRSGDLSCFIGGPGDFFDGGPKVKQFESACCEIFNTRFALSVNSATSGLIAAMGAIGVSPGDEVIVPPQTMSATAIAPLFYGGIPVFADVELDTFCIDPADVEAKVTERTRAIVAVNLFGHPAKLRALRAIADDYGIYLIEDNAQAPLATEDGVLTGSIGHIGVLSFNYHKHVHTGEGGVCLTDDEELALRIRLIRNHGENLIDHLQVDNLENLLGFNFRMTEVSAAIGVEQLKKINVHVENRTRAASLLSKRLEGLPGLTLPVVRDGCRHVFYSFAIKLDSRKAGISRKLFVDALAKEGVPLVCGYVPPLYRLPLFQKGIAIGNSGFPFSLSKPEYDKTRCSNAELMHDELVMVFIICSYDLNGQTIQEIGNAFEKILEHKDILVREKRLLA